MSNDARFGAVKVETRILSKMLDSRTYVVTNRTTARELVSIVLASYKIICQDPAFFYLTLERTSTGRSGFRSVRLTENARPLDVQAHYPRAETKFSLKMSEGAGVVSVHDGCIKPGSASKTICLSVSATCEDLLRLFLEDSKLPANSSKYRLVEVDASSKGFHELKPTNKPVVIQHEWLDQYEYYFEVRLRETDPNLIRRTHSLDHLEEIAAKRAQRKPLVLKRRSWTKKSSGIKSDAESKKSTSERATGSSENMSKLKDSLSKLREHLDNIQKRKELSGGSGSSTSGFQSASNETSPGVKSASLLPPQGVRADDSSDSDCEADYKGRRHATRKSHQRRKRSSFNNNTDIKTDSLYAFNRRRLENRVASENAHYHGQASTLPGGARVNGTGLEGVQHGGLAASAENLIITSPSGERLGSGFSQSVQDIPVIYADGGLDDAAKSDSRRSSMNSLSSRSKSRRSLPSVPGGGNDMEERKKRMSLEAVRKARAEVQKRNSDCSEISNENLKYLEQKTQSFTSLVDTEQATGYSERLHDFDGYNGTNESYRDHQVNSGHNTVNTKHMHNGEGYKDNIHKRGKESRHTEHLKNLKSQTETSERGKPPDYYTTISDRLLKPEPRRESLDNAVNGSNSQGDVQQLISDLRVAATKPLSYSPASKNDSTSANSPLSHDLLSNPNRGNHTLAVNQHTSPPESVMRCLEVSRTPLENEAPSSLDPSFMHPSVFHLLRSCDILAFELKKNHGTTRSNFGIEIFEAVYVDNADEHSRQKVFRTPSGRRPVLGSNGGAFMRVRSPNTQDNSKTLSLIAIDFLQESSPATEVDLHECDYIVEVNGSHVINAGLEQVRQEIAASDRLLKLVVARPRPPLPPKTEEPSQTEKQICEREVPKVDYEKEMEKVKLKYHNLRQENERNMDVIADMTIERKAHQGKMSDLENVIREQQNRMRDLEKQVQEKQEGIAQWKIEANQRSVDIAKLKFDSRIKDDKIAQLRQLIVQQSELMHIHDTGDISIDEYEDYEDVSAV